MFGYTDPRQRQTTLPCRRCGARLVVRRGCRSVLFHCEECRAVYELSEYIAEVDEELEEFLAGSFCDRV